jgi:hypothetical protein
LELPRELDRAVIIGCEDFELLSCGIIQSLWPNHKVSFCTVWLTEGEARPETEGTWATGGVKRRWPNGFMGSLKVISQTIRSTTSNV